MADQPLKKHEKVVTPGGTVMTIESFLENEAAYCTMRDREGNELRGEYFSIKNLRRLAPPRSCYDCIHRPCCLMFNAVYNFPAQHLRLEENEAGGGLRRVDLYDTLAGCCLLFEGRQDA